MAKTRPNPYHYWVSSDFSEFPKIIPTMKGGETVAKPSDNDEINEIIEEAKIDSRNLAGIDTKRKRPINMHDKVKTLAIKVYDEQLPKGWATVKQLIRKVDKNRYHVIGILHNRDNVSTDAFLKSIEKPHYHIIVRTANTHSKNVRVSTLLKMLGIKYRPDLDAMLWNNHGVELVSDYNIYTLYLLHETVKAIRELKAPYDLKELISNLSRKELEGIIELGRQVETPAPTKLAEIINEAYERGYKLLEWDDFEKTIPIKIQTSKGFPLINKSYNRGIKKRINDDEDITRCAIFIEGPSSIGKTYAIRQALSGRNVKDVSDGETGKFDDLTITTDAIIINDATIKHLHNLADDRRVQLYRRNNNNPYWCGDMLIVSSNDPFKKWVQSCGEKVTETILDPYADPNSNDPMYKKIPTESFIALKKRFFICDIENINGINRLMLRSFPQRGNTEKIKKKLAMFQEFQRKFNEIIATYEPSDLPINLDEINYTQEELEQMNATKKAAEEKAIREAEDRAILEEQQRQEQLIQQQLERIEKEKAKPDEIKQLKRKIDSLSRKLEDEQKRNQKIENTLRNTTNEKDALSKELSIVKSDYYDVRRELDNYKEFFEECEEEMMETVRE